ncbi:PREDICTED: ADP-ribosylation factor-like protein 4C isoform X1 [Lipotes vexillifer]|uniref:ADP-ribosylation factor-like protein 4C isoform X1 n=1 Tax=Lipotes vexillifer TaxID=118797 RepID=A0A340XUX6_LIPVE|nr:PREDICTED: ADP-ribosylation factor-like protein 4C isoform X1 [Lipotes vexillifer]
MGNISSNISAFQSLHIVMLGLDSAGKTTVLYRLKFNEFVNTVPTIGFNTEKIKLSNGTAKGISCHFWDVGGQEKLRPLWKSYSRCTDGIIYVVDSVDVDRLEEAKTELHKVTKFAENQGTPLLVIANKQDLPKSLPVAEIEKQLALHELIPATTYHVQPACAIIGEGLTEGMDKLYEMILKRRKSLKQKKKRTSDSTWVCRQTCQPELDLPSPLAQGTFCLNARAAKGLGAPLGSGRAGPAVCPPGPGWKAQMSETKAISSYCSRARSSGFPALNGDRTCEFPEVCGSQNPGSTRLGTWWQWEVLGGTASPWAVKAGQFYVTGQAPVKIHLSCPGPKRGAGLGHQRTAWNSTAAGRHGALRWPPLGNAREECPFPGALW